MMSSYYFAIIFAVLVGHLQFQAIVVARVASPVNHRANATIGHSAFAPGNKNYTRAVPSPNRIAPASHHAAVQATGLTSPSLNRPWLSANQNPAQAVPLQSGWIASNHSQPGALPSVWFQTNPFQGQFGTPAHSYGRSNGTVYPSYNQTVQQRSPTVHGRSNSSPYGNLSI